MPFVITTAVSVLFLLAFSSMAFATDVSRASIAADCRAEGSALGIKPEDLNEYVKECVKEFLESRMGNHQPRKSSR
jgi:hypothetical protein